MKAVRIPLLRLAVVALAVVPVGAASAAPPDPSTGGCGPAVINGTEADDRLYGISNDGSDQQIFGFAGDDLLDGLHGNDCLFGGEGDDYLTGGDGDGDDHLDGGPGKDDLDGEAGEDFLDGGSGNDVLESHSPIGRDTIMGGSGNDEILTHHARRIFGGGGRDLIKAGNQRRERIDCGKGRDVAYADRGRGRRDRVRNCERVIRTG
jgi:Ca2+-binding RTX toxin-like protein